MKEEEQTKKETEEAIKQEEETKYEAEAAEKQRKADQELQIRNQKHESEKQAKLQDLKKKAENARRRDAAVQAKLAAEI